MNQELDDETKVALKALIDHFEDEDRAVRDRQIRVWRRLKLLWENMQHTYYSEVAHDWRVPQMDDRDESDQAAYDKPINLFRAYLESIIAALSVTVPPITCYPDDADNPLDMATAKTGDKIASLIFKHNDAPLLWIHALFIFATEGMCACYTYSKDDKKFGEYEKKKKESYDQPMVESLCPLCQAQIAQEDVIQPQADKFGVGEEDAPIDDLIHNDGLEELCPNCGQMVIPDKRNGSYPITRITGVTKHPKSRTLLEVYGGLFVKVPVWARNQAECNYLIYSYETHYANVLEAYPDLRETISRGGTNYDLYEQWGRTSPQYHGEHPVNNVTVRNAWFRPSAFNILTKEQCDKLKKLYPDGVKAVVVNDQVAEGCNDNLDDCWTLTYNPLSDYIHFDPLGLLLTSVQDITNDLVSLVLQTIEHGIPQTFADPKVLNFNAYRNAEVIPGGIYPATPKSGRPLGEGFYEVKTATLSQEVLPFAESIQQMGQMTSGALPSLFGGQMAGSRTASEYSMSRNQALQRLQNTWKMLTMWWKQVFAKAIPLYIKNMKDDEKQVKKDEFGNFVNVFIRRSELEGKIGDVELEANENLPITWNQQKDAIMELFQLNNEGINAALASPENMPFIKKAIGLTDYIIPGEDDRQKQYEEIQLLVNSEPIEMPPDPMMIQQAMAMGQPVQPVRVPSIQVDPDVDNHALEGDICRRWLVSDAGRMCKLDNPLGYENVLLHYKMHKQIDMQMQMMQQQMAQPQSTGEQPGGQNSTGEQLQEGQNAPTVQ